MSIGIKVKVCGMRNHLNIQEVVGVAPDYLGFIEYQNSPRYVGEDFFIPVDVPTSVLKVGVFVKESGEVILRKVKVRGYDYVQLHGNESVEECVDLQNNGIKVIKVFQVDDAFDFRTTKPYVTVSDYFLFDTRGKLYGGNAKAFDWSILKHYDQEVPFFLSGGLSKDNINGIDELRHMNLHAVDLNSGVEQSPGVKDIQKVRDVVGSIRKDNSKKA